MDPLMFKAAWEGSTETLLRLLRDEPLILERTITTSCDTPLHIAAMLGRLDFVKELIKHKTNAVDYVREPNQHGFSAIHLASANGHIDIVQELLTVSNELCYLKGKDEMTPLHCACVKGRVATINYLLSVSSTTVLDLTVRGESALHLAVKNNKLEAVETLVECVKQNNQLEILNSKDEEGNTILHLAAARRNRQTLELVLKCSTTNPGLVQINAMNESRLTPLDLVRLIPCEFSTDDIERLLKDAGAERGNPFNDIAPATQDHQNQTQSEPRNLSREEILNWEDYFEFDFKKSNPDQTRSDLLVVAVLMATATYQAVLSPPGGFNDAGSHKGEARLASGPFVWFIISNSAGFFTSLFLLTTLTNGYPLFWELYVAIFAMAVTYDTAISSLSPPGHLRDFCFVVSVLFPLFIPISSYTIRKWYKRRRRGAFANMRHQTV